MVLNNNNLAISIIFTLILVWAETGAGAAVDPHFEACRRPISCGDNQTIRYPFYIQNRQQPFCGYPGFALKCHPNGHPLLRLAGGDYSVRRISYDTNSLRLSPSSGSGSGSGCDSLIRNISSALGRDERFRVAPGEACGEEAARNGFSVEWTAGECRFCSDSGGFCGFNESIHHFKCYCPDRPHAWHCTPIPG